MKNIVLIMTLIVSCLFAGCDSLANKSEDKLSGDDFWAQGNETNAEITEIGLEWNVIE